MTRKERKFKKQVLGVYYRCMNVVDRYIEPEIWRNGKNEVVKVQFSKNRAKKLLNERIQALKAELK